ncbi:hypothetical protein [Sphingomonas sp.]|uniref:hypothetical protein n=1 Tax=Sphingomonas sp. TaxID=28214 RepID=UPI0031E1187F
MKREIRAELIKMSLVMAVMIGIGVYAHDFVIAGIKAKMALNLSIFALFTVAAIIAFRNVLALRNEVQALRALQLSTEEQGPSPDIHDAPAIVFHEPHLLGQGYRLIAEQLAKDGTVNLPSKVAESLVHSVDQRINEQKSVILYFSGLMVFMGLIGAFMGLMHTVGSVGDLIGGMDVSGTAGGDSFGKMIEGMKAPLRGMSVGFSSSLFGLSTSMVLGALERCMTKAAKSLRDDYEHWLSSVTTLEGASEVETGGTRGAGSTSLVRAMDAAARQLAALHEAVEQERRLDIRMSETLSELYEAMAGLSRMVERIADPTLVLVPIADAVADLGRHQIRLTADMEMLFSQVRSDRAHLNDTIASLRDLAVQQRHAEREREDRIVRRLDQLLACGEAVLEREPMVLQWPLTTDHAPPQMEARALHRRLMAAFGGRRDEARKVGEYRRFALDIRETMERQYRLQEELRVEVIRFRSAVSADRRKAADILGALALERDRLSALAEMIEAGDAPQNARVALDQARAHMSVLTARAERLRKDMAVSDTNYNARAE